MPAAIGLAPCFYSNIAINGIPSGSALELAHNQITDMHTLRKSDLPWFGPARGSTDLFVVWDSSNS